MQVIGLKSVWNSRNGIMMLIPLAKTYDESRWQFLETADGDLEFKLLDPSLKDVELVEMLQKIKPKVRFSSILSGACLSTAL